jgi:signal transduction histidine kinase
MEAFGPLSDEQKEYLGTINSAADDMLSLVNDLLDVSVIESGKLELQLRPGSLNDLLEYRIKMNKVVGERKNITLRAELSEIREAVFDANRIAQVIDNLIGNAMKFSPPGSTVYISSSEDGEAATVRVRDEGPGIPPEEQSRLFGEFQRLSVQPTGGEKSTGLGLAIVKKIIDAHQGTLKVESEPGSGSTFSFTIPLCK